MTAFEEAKLAAEEAKLAELAAAIGCFTEQEMRLLTDWSAETLRTYRKRGEGPPVVRFGSNYFYPREKVAEYLRSRVRLHAPTSPKGLL